MTNRRRRARNTLLFALFATVLLNLSFGIAAECSHWLRDPMYGDKELLLKQREAACMPNEPKVLMLGTSRTGFGFHARRVEERMQTALGRPAMAFNFGVPASGPVTHVLYLRRLLEAGHKPNLLLVEVLPSSLAILEQGPLEHYYISGDRLRQSEVEEAIRYGFPPEEPRAKWWNAMLSPWYTLRFPIMGRIANGWLPWQHRQDSGRAGNEVGWIDPMVSEVPLQKKKEAFANARIQYAAYLASMTPGGGAGEALADLLALAREHGVPVKLVVMPESTEFRAFYSPEVAARIHAMLDTLSLRYGIEWIDARTWLPDDVFYDGHHVLRPGVEAFSDRLAESVIVPFFRAVK